MAYEHKPNTGSLFPSEKKTDKHPDRTGSALIDGVEYWVAGWDKAGGKHSLISLAFTRKDAKKPESAKLKPEDSGSIRDMPDDLPF